jgi:hypothetical protein
LQREPDPADVDVSGRGETQPASEDASERFAEQTERQERHNEPARDPNALYGPAGHDESSEATIGSDASRGPGRAEEADVPADEHPPHPGQSHPS